MTRPGFAPPHPNGLAYQVWSQDNREVPYMAFYKHIDNLMHTKVSEESHCTIQKHWMVAPYQLKVHAVMLYMHIVFKMENY